MAPEAQEHVEEGGDDVEHGDKIEDTGVRGGHDVGIRADSASGYTCEDTARRDEPRAQSGDHWSNGDTNYTHDVDQNYRRDDNRTSQAGQRTTASAGALLETMATDGTSSTTKDVAGTTASVDDAVTWPAKGATAAQDRTVPTTADDMTTTAGMETTRKGADDSQHAGGEGRNAGEMGGSGTTPAPRTASGGWVAASKKRSAQLNRSARKRAQRRVED